MHLDRFKTPCWNGIIVLLLTAVLCLNIKVFRLVRPVKMASPSALAAKYLCGLNGVEVGMSTQNSFHLTDPSVCKKVGGFANVDFAPGQGGAWQDAKHTPAIVNIVANADNLPLKDNSIDYVLSSHMIEHAFDPIGTIQEWLRVIRKGGYVFMIIPHLDRTFDKHRDVTSVKELIGRHSGNIKYSDYIFPKSDSAVKEYLVSHGLKIDKLDRESLQHLGPNVDKVYEGWVRYKEDDHHHWSVWRTDDFISLCKAMNWNVVEYQDTDDKVGNGFTIVIQK